MKQEKFIDVKKLIASKNPKLVKWIPGFVISYLKRIIHEDEINDFLSKHNHKYDADFCDAVLQYLNVTVEFIGLENIPKEGPVIIAMNHPLGGLDGVAFISELSKTRKDIKFIVNDLLMNLENLKGVFVGVNKHGKNGGNIRKEIETAFESNDAIGIFPAGLVSRKSKGEIKDLEWKKTFIVYAKKLDQAIIPIHIEGQLSKFFYRFARFRKFLGIKFNIEMLFLADEMFNFKNKKITFTIGKPIYYKDLNATSDLKKANEVKEIVYQLSKK